LRQTGSYYIIIREPVSDDFVITFFISTLFAWGWRILFLFNLFRDMVFCSYNKASVEYYLLEMTRSYFCNKKNQNIIDNRVNTKKNSGPVKTQFNILSRLHVELVANDYLRRCILHTLERWMFTVEFLYIKKYFKVLNKWKVSLKLSGPLQSKDCDENLHRLLWVHLHQRADMQVYLLVGTSYYDYLSTLLVIEARCFHLFGRSWYGSIQIVLIKSNQKSRQHGDNFWLILIYYVAILSGSGGMKINSRKYEFHFEAVLLYHDVLITRT